MDQNDIIKENVEDTETLDASETTLNETEDAIAKARESAKTFFIRSPRNHFLGYFSLLDIDSSFKVSHQSQRERSS